MITLTVNGREKRLHADPETPLLWVLRDHLGLTGTKYSCGTGECGACTVHVDGEAIPSCAYTLGEMAGRRIVTIEGLDGPVALELKKVWTEEGVPQCGYCQPGQIMTAASFLKENPDPGDRDIREAMSSVLCRCGTYSAVARAVRIASRRISS